jgi:hypothetical protein
MFELVIPVNALKAYKGKKLEAIQTELVAWVEATAPELPHPDRPFAFQDSLVDPEFKLALLKKVACGLG